MILTDKRVRQIICEEIYRSISTYPMLDISIEGVPLQAELANTQFLRNQGLMYRQSIPDNSGMLFVFPRDEIQGFWMKNTSIPLSIAFIDDRGIITNIEDLHPHDHSSRFSTREVPYALEMKRGWFRENGLHPGCTVSDLPRLPNH